LPLPLACAPLVTGLKANLGGGELDEQR
jgi:hypothetical protein